MPALTLLCFAWPFCFFLLRNSAQYFLPPQFLFYLEQCLSPLNIALTLSSPPPTTICAQAPHLLVTPLPASAGATAQAQIKSAPDLIRYILSRVTTAVLEVWACPSLPAAGPAVTAALVTVLGHCTEGVGSSALGLLRAQSAAGGAGGAGGRGAAAGAAGGFRPDAGIVQNIVEMGFPQVCKGQPPSTPTLPVPVLYERPSTPTPCSFSRQYAPTLASFPLPHVTIVHTYIPVHTSAGACGGRPPSHRCQQLGGRHGMAHHAPRGRARCCCCGPWCRCGSARCCCRR